MRRRRGPRPNPIGAARQARAAPPRKKLHRADRCCNFPKCGELWAVSGAALSSWGYYMYRSGALALIAATAICVALPSSATAATYLTVGASSLCGGEGCFVGG